MSMLETMLVIIVAGMVIYLVGVGLITLNHKYAIRRSNGLARFITTDVKEMLEQYTDDLLEKSMNYATEMTKKMMGEIEE